MKSKDSKLELSEEFNAYIRPIQNKIGKYDLWSLALYLTNYYFAYYDKGEENIYIKEKKATLVCIDLLEWLLHNYHQLNNLNFSFKESNQKADRSLIPLKKKIYQNWLKGDFKNLIKKTKWKIENGEKISNLLEKIEEKLAKISKKRGCPSNKVKKLKLKKIRLRKKLANKSTKFYYEFLKRYETFKAENIVKIKKELGL